MSEIDDTAWGCGVVLAVAFLLGIVIGPIVLAVWWWS